MADKYLIFSGYENVKYKKLKLGLRNYLKELNSFMDVWQRQNKLRLGKNNAECRFIIHKTVYFHK